MSKAFDRQFRCKQDKGYLIRNEGQFLYIRAGLDSLGGYIAASLQPLAETRNKEICLEIANACAEVQIWRINFLDGRNFSKGFAAEVFVGPYVYLKKSYLRPVQMRETLFEETSGDRLKFTLLGTSRSFCDGDDQNLSSISGD